MPAVQGTPSLRRPILRFSLASVSIDNRPNAYKDPQLVLKPQLDTAPRRPYTGSRPRVPLWRYFLMVHVKDKADELVKLGLDAFNTSSGDADTTIRHSVACLFSRCSLVFRYPKGTNNDSSTLSITLQKRSDLDAVLDELNTLNVYIEYEQAIPENILVPGPAGFGTWVPQAQTIRPVRRLSSDPRQLNSSSPPLIARPSSRGQYPTNSEGYLQAASLYRPPSQPTGQPQGVPTGQRPWSPAFVPLRPATTLGVPGILGEGIYKVSKIGSVSSNQPRVRRTSTISEHQPAKFYTVSKHFDKTLSRGDILHSSRAHYLGRGLPSGLQTAKSAEHRSRSPSHDAAGAGRNEPTAERLPRIPSTILEGVPVNIQHPPGLRRLRTINDALGPSQSARVDINEHTPFLSRVEEENAGFVFSQPELARRSIDDVSLFSSSPTLLEIPPRQEMEDDWLLQVSQIQHQGLCEASKVWDEFMERVSLEVASAERSENFSAVLSKYEDEFLRRWEAVVAATVGKMRTVQRGNSAS